MRLRFDREWYKPTGDKVEEIKATDSSAVAYLEPYVYKAGINEGKSAFHAVAFSGKRAKPDWNYTFQSEQTARAYIQKHADNVKAGEESMAQRKAERYDVHAPDHYKVGDLFYSSWGYDQTNIEFWKIVRVMPKAVEIVAIGAKTVPGSEGFMSDHISPDPDRVLVDDGRTWAIKHNGVKRVQRCGNSVHFRIHDHSSAHPISLGGSVYESWYH